MLPPKLVKMTKEQLPSAKEPWLEQVLQWINQYFQQTWNVLNGNLTVGDNVTGLWNTFQVKAYQDGPTVKIPRATVQWKHRKYVQGVFLSRIIDKTAPQDPIAIGGLQWYQSDDAVVITHVAGLTDGHTYDITVLVL